METVLPRVANIRRLALDLLFPQFCVGCGREGAFICPSCRESLPRLKPPLCPGCGIPQAQTTPCPKCHERELAIDGIRAPFQFEGTIRRAVIQLKYHNLRALAETLAELLSEYLATNPIPGEVLVPVPLHPKRLRERGYNQSELLARKLGQLSGSPLAADCLVRKRHTTPQTQTKTASERRRNVADAFTCRNQSLADRQVLLLDDVATSGATLDGCARALKAAGASSVWGLSLARDV